MHKFCIKTLLLFKIVFRNFTSLHFALCKTNFQFIPVSQNVPSKEKKEMFPKTLCNLQQVVSRYRLRLTRPTLKTLLKNDRFLKMFVVFMALLQLRLRPLVSVVSALSCNPISLSPHSQSHYTTSFSACE